MMNGMDQTPSAVPGTGVTLQQLIKGSSVALEELQRELRDIQLQIEGRMKRARELETMIQANKAMLNVLDPQDVPEQRTEIDPDFGPEAHPHG